MNNAHDVGGENSSCFMVLGVKVRIEFFCITMIEPYQSPTRDYVRIEFVPKARLRLVFETRDDWKFLTYQHLCSSCVYYQCN